jgi:ribose transport system ATP-binding protein
MDEPTAVLSQEEAKILFDQMRRLKAQGTSFVFVSHKLDEVMAIADRVTVLRDGQWVKTAPASELDGEAIAQLMVGRELSTLYPIKHEPNVDAEIALSVKSLTTGYVKGASFDVKRGEIFGFSGLIGSGRTELMEAICGIRSRHHGEVFVYGEAIPAGNVQFANKLGLAYLTKDRKGKGLLLGQGMEVNLTLQSLMRHGRFGYVDRSSESASLATARRRFDIRVRDRSVVAGRMSGGNQQKLLLAKVMETEPRVIIIDEPTRGIDVGTKQQIYHFISSLARDGWAVVVVSSEMPEVIGLCTRMAVMREGRIVGLLEGDEINEQEIMRYAAGLKLKEAS